MRTITRRVTTNTITTTTEVIETSDRPSAPMPAAPDVETEGEELPRPGLKSCRRSNNVVQIRRAGGMQ